MRVLTCVVLLCALLFAAPVAAEMPQIDAAAAIAYNPKTNEVLWQNNANVQRSIASLTKLMTAYALLDAVDFTRVVIVEARDTRNASRTFLRPRDAVTVENLMNLMLVTSDNGAARVLARIAGADFIARMNAKAQELGLLQTRFVDSSGLSANNKSTAYDMARLLSIVSMHDSITSIMQKASYSFRTRTKKPRTVTVPNTNHLARGSMPTLVAGKTGFIRAAGFCLATMMRTENGDEIVLVVLGTNTNLSRFEETQELYTWARSYIDSLLIPGRVPIDMRPLTFPEWLRECSYPDATSAIGIRFIKEHEGFHPRAYRDAGGYAIGYGFHRWKGRAVTLKYPGRVTRAQADAEMKRQLLHFENVVRESVCAKLSQHAFDALVSVAWNLGRINTSIIEKLEEWEDVTLADFMTTATVSGRPHPALQQRREMEYYLYSGSIELVPFIRQ